MEMLLKTQTGDNQLTDDDPQMSYMTRDPWFDFEYRDVEMDEVSNVEIEEISNMDISKLLEMLP